MGAPAQDLDRLRRNAVLHAKVCGLCAYRGQTDDATFGVHVGVHDVTLSDACMEGRFYARSLGVQTASAPSAEPVAMSYDAFLDRAIDDGVAAARKDYAAPRDVHKLEGAIAGFEACRRLRSQALVDLLAASRAKLRDLADERAEPAIYGRQSAFVAEVHWIACVVAGAIHLGGKNPPIAPTARSTMKAAEILRGGRVEA